MWISWNEMETMSELEYELWNAPDNEEDHEESQMEQGVEFGPDIIMRNAISDLSPNLIHTPFGHVPFDSRFKPTDRWQCWLGYTNFDITKTIADKLQKIEGVDILKVLSRYSFCIGVGKMFEFAQVRQDVEHEICN